MEVNSRFWEGKRVLITGHTGFKGAWLTLWLQKMGADVMGYSLKPSTRPSLFQLLKLERGMKSVLGDVREFSNLKKNIASHKPEFVFHLAAQALVRTSYRDPVGTYATNIMGTVNLLEAVRQTEKTRVVVNITSDKCYQNTGKDKSYTEIDPMGGHDPYSSSKGCAELVSDAYRNSFFQKNNQTALATTRAGNVIGGGDWSEDRLIPDIIRSASAKKPLVIRNPGSTRPWQFVLEPLSGYLLLAEHLSKGQQKYAEGWNFGPREKDARPVRWMVQKFTSQLNQKLRVQIRPDKKLHEAQRLKLDSSKAHKRLGWTPRLTVDQAIDWTVEWYQSYLNKSNVRFITEHQIESFQSLRSR